jgi:prophage regulatory protein
MHLDTKKLLMRQSALLEVLGLSRSGLDKLRKKDPTFPAPIKDGSSRQAPTYFVVAEVEAWVATLIAKRDGGSK